MAANYRVLNASTSSAQIYHNRWLFIAGPTIIEEFIDCLAIFMRGLLAGRVSGGLLYPEAEMFKNLPYYLRIGNETSETPRPQGGAS
jgi:hypothetical protein